MAQLGGQKVLDLEVRLVTGARPEEVQLARDPLFVVTQSRNRRSYDTKTRAKPRLSRSASSRWRSQRRHDLVPLKPSRAFKEPATSSGSGS